MCLLNATEFLSTNRDLDWSNIVDIGLLCWGKACVCYKYDWQEIWLCVLRPWGQLIRHRPIRSLKAQRPTLEKCQNQTNKTIYRNRTKPTWPIRRRRRRQLNRQWKLHVFTKQQASNFDTANSTATVKCWPGLIIVKENPKDEFPKTKLNPHESIKLDYIKSAGTW